MNQTSSVEEGGSGKPFVHYQPYVGNNVIWGEKALGRIRDLSKNGIDAIVLDVHDYIPPSRYENFLGVISELTDKGILVFLQPGTSRLHESLPGKREFVEKASQQGAISLGSSFVSGSELVEEISHIIQTSNICAIDKVKDRFLTPEVPLYTEFFYALYSVSDNGISSLPADHFTNHFPVSPSFSFMDKISLTINSFRSTFLGGDNHSYDYLLNSGIGFYIAKFPWVTFSCQDKVNMCNSLGLDLSRDMKLQDTIKAVYFWDREEKKYHIAVIPGQPDGTQIDQKTSFREVCQKELGMSGKYFKNNFRLFPGDEQLAFGVMQEGCFSPLIPSRAIKDGKEVSGESMVDVIYFDANHLALYDDPAYENKLDDLSISMRLIPCMPGQYVEKRVGKNDVKALTQLIDGEKVPLNTVDEKGQLVAYVTAPLFGECRDAKRTGDEVLLRFTYVPNHLFSLLMSYKDVHDLLDQTFPGKVHAVDMKYHHKSK
ncbi:hypothetical protein ACFL0W_03455 [Nanoarchaeota archaeon]